MKTIKSSITFYTTPDLDPNQWEDMTDEEMLVYVKEVFHDDIVDFVKHNELWDVINVELIND